jgi:two-component system, chemotaxis family, protein-glutamate methylesterase/glutaminase
MIARLWSSSVLLPQGCRPCGILLRDCLLPLAMPVLAVLHVGAQRGELPALLNAVGPTPAKHGEDGELIRLGHLYLAPPDRHMIVDGERIRLPRGPKENWARPAIDPLFRSAALCYGPSAIGVFLTAILATGRPVSTKSSSAGGRRSCRTPRPRTIPPCRRTPHPSRYRP